ncbi:hypothetical protein HS088_TW17G00249 [Tripterygium wilfordii]|uniref:Uncharacterized protein n=1 Tax=Tripterygium wilfordii TaxID=458696 RepID=A0A7J7CF00_TRIWF|nr:hypothetical protein HS088_TW17G00249 [Tripterygium wilfordii]
MDTKSAVDVLPWMLVESTGDSEIDARIGRASDFNDNDDDAESCTCDESEDFDPDNPLRDLRRRFDAVDDQDRKDEKARVHVQEEARGCRRNYGGDEQKGVPIPKPILCHKSSASIDSTEEEKNKLFWEACLAS